MYVPPTIKLSMDWHMVEHRSCWCARKHGRFGVASGKLAPWRNKVCTSYLKIEYGLKHGGMGHGKRARVSVHGIVHFTIGRCTGGTYFQVTLVKGCQKNRKIEKNTLFGNGASSSKNNREPRQWLKTAAGGLREEVIS